MWNKVLKKIFISILSFVLIIGSTKSILADDDVFGHGYFEYKVDDYGVYIVNYLGNEEEIYMPNSIAGLPVYKICKGAFNSCTDTKTLYIPDTVITIEDESIRLGINIVLNYNSTKEDDVVIIIDDPEDDPKDEPDDDKGDHGKKPHIVINWPEKGDKPSKDVDEPKTDPTNNDDVVIENHDDVTSDNTNYNVTDNSNVGEYKPGIVIGESGSVDSVPDNIDEIINNNNSDKDNHNDSKPVSDTGLIADESENNRSFNYAIIAAAVLSLLIVVVIVIRFRKKKHNN